LTWAVIITLINKKITTYSVAINALRVVLLLGIITHQVAVAVKVVDSFTIL